MIENPSDEKSTLALAQIYAENRDFERGLKILSEFKKNYNDSAELHYNYALICSLAGDLGTAYRETNLLLEKNPDNSDYQLLFGRLLVWLNRDLITAQNHLENFLNQNPESFKTK